MFLSPEEVLTKLLCLSYPFRSDDSDDDYEMSDNEINKIIIVTQTPPAVKKHPGGDRTGYHESRSKITSDLSKIINDGLYYYELGLWEDIEVCSFVKYLSLALRFHN